MSKFRAINQRSESPPKPNSRRQHLSEVSSPQSCEPQRGQTLGLKSLHAVSGEETTHNTKQRESPKVLVPAMQSRVTPTKETARPWAAVIPPEQQNFGQSINKVGIRKAVARATRATHTPSKKKPRLSSSISQPSRQQAVREKKLVPSIEDSARMRIASSTPPCDKTENEESEYMPSPAAMAKMDLSSTAKTPSRRHIREHASTCPNAGSSPSSDSGSDSLSLQPSPKAGDSNAVVKKEYTRQVIGSPHPEALSPAIWSSPFRRKKYEEVEFVELPKAVFEYERFEKEILQQLAAKKEILNAGRQMEKMKLAMRKPVDETQELTQKIGKRKTADEVGQDKPRKRQKSAKDDLDDRSTTDSRKLVGEENRSSKRMSAQKSPTGKTMRGGAQRYQVVAVKAEDRTDINDVRSHVNIEARGCSPEGCKDKGLQRPFQAGAETRDFKLHEKQSDQSSNQTSRDSGQRRRPFDDEWRKPYQRREISVPEIRRTCSCALLPEHFMSDLGSVPNLATWPGGQLEFFEHVKQISCCRGSIHPPGVIDACRRMLRKRGYPNRGDEQSLESVFEFAHGFLSTNDRDDNHSGRAPSSITPPTFYGHAQSYRPSSHVGSSSHSANVKEKTPQSLSSHSGRERIPPRKEAASKITPLKTLAVRESVKDATNPTDPLIDRHPSAIVFEDTNDFLTPTDSSPLDKRRGADVANGCILNGSSPIDENVGEKRNSKNLPKGSSEIRQPRISFSAQRQRHQSVPVNLGNRYSTLNERDPAPRQRIDNTLQARSNNTVLLKKMDDKMDGMDRKMTSLEKDQKVLLERLLAASNTQSAAVRPEPAPTVAAAAEGGNHDAQTHVRKRKKKRASRAERQQKLPVLSSEVPDHLLLTEPEIIEIGRIVNHYERHRRAPQAFGWGGNLFAKYDHLKFLNINGVPVWTAQEISRMRR